MDKLEKLNDYIELAEQEGRLIDNALIEQKKILEESLIEECIIPDLQFVLSNIDSCGIHKEFDIQIHFDTIKGFEIHYGGKTYVP